VIEYKIVQDTTKKFRVIKYKKKVTSSRQKSYCNQRSKDLSFEVGDFVFLRVMSTRSW